MFEHLAQHKHILVTGMPRSGTRIIARMIAHDTGHGYVDETEFKNKFDNKLTNIEKLKFYMNWWPNLVVQSPQLSYCCHELGMFVVWCKRSPVDVKKSMDRIKMQDTTIKAEIENYAIDTEDTSAESLYSIKEGVWLQTQKAVVNDNFLEVNYEDIKTHPLYVERRENFVWCQTK